MLHCIEMGWFVLDKYYTISGDTLVYAAALLLNPSKRSKYIKAIGINHGMPLPLMVLAKFRRKNIILPLHQHLQRYPAIFHLHLTGCLTSLQSSKWRS